MIGDHGLTGERIGQEPEDLLVGMARGEDEQCAFQTRACAPRREPVRLGFGCSLALLLGMGGGGLLGSSNATGFDADGAASFQDALGGLSAQVQRQPFGERQHKAALLVEGGAWMHLGASLKLGARLDKQGGA